MSRKILGLDVRKDEITACLLVHSINGNQITAVEHVVNKDEQLGNTDDDEITEEGSSQKNTSSEEDFLNRALSYISTKIDLSGCICIASLPSEVVSFRNISVPFKSPKDIMRVLPYELEPSLPFSVSNINIDFKKINITDSEELITAIIDQDYLDGFRESLSAHNLNPYVVSVGSYSTALNLIQTGDQHIHNGIFLDIDRTKCSLSLYASGQICFFRNFPVNIESPDISTDIVCHINQTMISFHESFEKPFNPEIIYVNGSGLPGLNIENELYQQLNIQVKKTNLIVANKFETVIPGTWQPEIMDNSLALASIEIFDMDTINFCEAPLVGKKIITEYKNRFVRTGILFLTVIFVALIGFFTDLYIMNTKVARLDTKIDDIFKMVCPTSRVGPEHKTLEMKNKIDSLKLVTGNPDKDKEKLLTIDILNRISKSIPKKIDVEVSKLVIGTENIQLSGETDSYDSVDEMKNRLERVNFFKNVNISSATIEKTSKRIRFKMKILL